VRARPPRAARALLYLAAPKQDRTFILEDLEGEFAGMLRQGRGAREARRWYWGQAMASLWPSLRRMGGRGRPPGEAPSHTPGLGLDTLVQDLRYGFRMLFRYPVLSVTVIVTLGLGIGFTSTVFNIVKGFVPRELPYPDSGRILAVDLTKPTEGIDDLGFTAVDFVRWRERQTVFESLGAYGWGGGNLSVEEGRAERRSGGFLTAGVLEALKVQPILGRIFRAEEERPGEGGVIILGHELWQSLFDGASDVLGKTVYVDRQPRTVVGIMPEGFMFPQTQSFWIPLTVDPVASGDPGNPDRWMVVGRLADGVSRGRAEAQLRSIAARLQSEFPADDAGVGVLVRSLKERIVPPQYLALFYTMLATTFGVLLIACANVANLLLARASVRTREVALRGALGAGRGRLVRQMLAEVLILSVVGGGIGLWLGLVGLDWFQATFDHVMAAAGGRADEIPGWMTFDRDLRAYLFVAGATVLSCAFAGMVPALRASATEAGEAIKAGSRGSRDLTQGRFTSSLVVAEVAMSCLLLILAGLMAKSVTQLGTVALPWRTEDVFTARFALPEEEYPEAADRSAFYERLLGKVKTIPGAVVASLSDGLPGMGHGSTGFELEGRTYAADEDLPRARLGRVTPTFFETFGVRAVRGRVFADADRAGTLPVALVNESFARTHLDGDPLGDRVRTGRDDALWRTVVGVVPDLSMEMFGSGGDPDGIYVPLSQAETDPYYTYFTVRANGPSKAVLTSIRDAVGSLDRYLPLEMVLPMDGIMLRLTWFYPVFGKLFMLFGIVALFLGAIGLYGVMSFAVTQRTQEMGVRMALGAEGRGLVGLVMRKGLIQLALGLGIGLGVALLAAGRMAFLMYEVGPRDPWVFAGVTATLAAAALVATIVPARRVTKVDVVVALRGE